MWTWKSHARAKQGSDEAKWLERKCCKNQLYLNLTGIEQKRMDPSMGHWHGWMEHPHSHMPQQSNAKQNVLTKTIGSCFLNLKT